MAGRLGNVKVTTQNLKILKVDHDNNLILIRERSSWSQRFFT